MENPIIDGRIVADKTFAVRLKRFLSQLITVGDGVNEECEYLKKVASDLLSYQISTLTDKDEKSYLLSVNAIRQLYTVEDLKDALRRHYYPQLLKARNIKTGHLYDVHRISTNATNANDGQEMVLYSDEGGRYYVREVNEFCKKFRW